MITHGLNERGATVSQGLGASLTALLLRLGVGIAEVGALAREITLVQFRAVGPGFRLDASSFHEEAGQRLSPQHTPTGESPQPDPTRVSVPLRTPFEDDSRGVEGPQHVTTGEDPQADPLIVTVPDLRTAEVSVAAAGPQHKSTGEDPQPDPDEAYVPKESGSEYDS